MKKIFFFLFISASIFAQKIDTLSVYSKSMQKNIKNVVIIPDADQDTKLPVLYLLHGASGTYSDWIKKVPQIKEYANQYQMIIVCPNGDPFSWYFDSPIDTKFKYETYISKELVNEIDSKYKTIASKKGRAITGLSMGGHGSFYLAFKHQDVFGATGSMSGGVDITKFKKSDWEIEKRLGTYKQHKNNWKNNSVIHLTDLLDNSELKIIFDCGIDDFFYEVNQNLHQKMLKNNIAHDYTQRPGAHTWKYWGNSIKYHMVFFDTYFKQSK